MRYLLDTHILVWWLTEPGRLSAPQREAVESEESLPLLVADISLWEIATLANLGRLEFNRPLRDWLEAATAPPLVRLCHLNPAVAAEVAALPDSFHRDPADRIIVSTARLEGATLLTSDARIRDSGLVAVV